LIGETTALDAFIIDAMVCEDAGPAGISHRWQEMQLLSRPRFRNDRSRQGRKGPRNRQPEPSSSTERAKLTGKKIKNPSRLANLDGFINSIWLDLSNGLKRAESD
jgi:hypothetical protein